MGNSAIENTEVEKLLGVLIDKHLNFETHVSKLCQKAGNMFKTKGNITPPLFMKELFRQ